MAVRSSVSVRRNGRVWAAGAIAAILAVAGLATTAEGQTSTGGRFSIAPTFGVAVPTGALGNYANAGPTAGLRIGYEIGNGLSLIADGGIDFLRSVNLYPGLANSIWTPEMTTQRYIAGIEATLGSDEAAPWSVLASIGAGASLFDSDEFDAPDGAGMQKFDYTAFTAAGGLELGYALTSRFEVVADGRLYWSVVDEDQTEPLAALGPARLDPFNSALTIPLVLALRARV